MALLIILLLVTLVLFAIFLGGGLVAQGYLYQEPADRMPVRALAAAVLVGSFITMWVGIDKAHPRRYDTLFELAGYERKEFSEFEAIRWTSIDGVNLKMDESGKPMETEVKYKRGTGGKADKFIEVGTDTAFQLNGGTKTGESYMVCAIKVKPDPEAEPIRLNALLKDEKRNQSKTPTYTPERRFVEENGSRYVDADQMGALYIPSTWAVILGLLLNFMLFVVWYAAFWPILQFTRGHAFALTTLFGLVTMLLVMPILFKPGRSKSQAIEPPKVAWVSHENRPHGPC